MMTFRLSVNEFRLLSRSWLARGFLLAIAISGALGLNAVKYSNQLVMHGMNQSSATSSLGSARYAALTGAALFAMLTLLTLSRDERMGSRSLLEASCDYRDIVWARIAALLAWACLTVLVTAIFGWVSHLFLCDAPYESYLYLFSYGVVSLPAMVFSVLICSGLYLATESLDVSFLTFGVLFVLGFTSSNYLFLWVLGSAAAYSDFGGITPVARYLIYNRMFWIFLASTVMLTGQLFLRRQGRGVFGSIAWNAKRLVIPGLMTVFIVLAVIVYRREPYLFANATLPHIEWSVSAAARLKTVESHLTLHPRDQSLTAEARYTFQKGPAATDIVFVTNAGLEIESLQINGAHDSWETIPGTDRIRLRLPEGPQAEVVFEYGGTIKVSAPGSFSGYICSQSVYLLEASYWLFRPLTETSGLIRASGSVVAPRELVVVTPGKLESVSEQDATRTWNYRAATRFLNLGVFAADYVIERMRVGELDVEFYFSRRHAEAIRKIELDKHTAEILAYYQEFLGPYAFDEWPIKVVEVPLYKPGGHSSLNIVTLAEYMLNRQPPDSPSRDVRFYIHDLKLVAHELAHQWWSTSVEIPESGPWTSEGLTEYTTYRYFTDNYSENLSSILVRGWKLAVETDRDNYYVRHPEVLQRVRPEFAERVTLGSRKVAVYDAMPLRLLKAEDHLGREEFSARLSAVYQSRCGDALSFDDFVAETGLTQEVLALE
jgi:hypothetical protein